MWSEIVVKSGGRQKVEEEKKAVTDKSEKKVEEDAMLSPITYLSIKWKEMQSCHKQQFWTESGSRSNAVISNNFRQKVERNAELSQTTILDEILW